MEQYNILKGENYFKNNIPIFLNIAVEQQINEYCKHKHDFIEIAYVYSGQGIHVVGDGKYEVSKGDLCIINYDIPHTFINNPMVKEDDLVIYNCVFRPEFIDYSLIHTNDFKSIVTSLLFNTFFIEDKPAVNLKLIGIHQKEIEELYKKMQEEFFLMPKGYINILRSCLIEMITKIFRYLEHNNNKSLPINHYKSEIIDKAISFLMQNYTSPNLRIEEVAIQSFLSRSYFSHLFKAISGQNFSEYLQNLRINEACHLLKTTDKKVTEILTDVGFKDIKNFNRLFKKITGTTPRDYRNSSKSQ